MSAWRLRPLRASYLAAVTLQPGIGQCLLSGFTRTWWENSHFLLLPLFFDLLIFVFHDMAHGHVFLVVHNPAFDLLI